MFLINRYQNKSFLSTHADSMTYDIYCIYMFKTLTLQPSSPNQDQEGTYRLCDDVTNVDGAFHRCSACCNWRFCTCSLCPVRYWSKR